MLGGFWLSADADLPPAEVEASVSVMCDEFREPKMEHLRIRYRPNIPLTKCAPGTKRRVSGQLINCVPNRFGSRVIR